MNKKTGNGRPGACILLLALLILSGCQPRVEKAPLPPLMPPAAAAPIHPPTRPIFYVGTNQLSLRTCPGTDCHRISTLALNTEVERMGEANNWTQVKIKKDGTIGYVSSKYLSPRPIQVVKVVRRKHKKAKIRQVVETPETAEKTEEGGPPKDQEPAPPFPKVM